MMRSKKAQLMEMAVVLMFVMMIIFLYGKTAQHKEIVTTIGDEQYLILDSYLEAEKAREYIKLSAKISALQVEGIDSGDNCFENLNSDSFKIDFEENIQKYIDNIISSRGDLNISLPIYEYRIDIQPSIITIKGYSDSKIKITGEKLEYSADPYFKQEITCSKKALLV